MTILDRINAVIGWRTVRPRLQFRSGEHHWLAGNAGTGKTRLTQIALRSVPDPNAIRVLVVTDHPEDWRIPWRDDHSLAVHGINPRCSSIADEYYEGIWTIYSQRALPGRMPVLVIEGGDSALDRIAAAVREIPGLTDRASIVLHTQSVVPLPDDLHNHFGMLTAFRCATAHAQDHLHRYAPSLTERKLLEIMSQRAGAYVSVPIG